MKIAVSKKEFSRAIRTMAKTSKKSDYRDPAVFQWRREARKLSIEFSECGWELSGEGEWPEKVVVRRENLERMVIPPYEGDRLEIEYQEDELRVAGIPVYGFPNFEKINAERALRDAEIVRNRARVAAMLASRRAEESVSTSGEGCAEEDIPDLPEPKRGWWLRAKRFFWQAAHFLGLKSTQSGWMKIYELSQEGRTKEADDLLYQMGMSIVRGTAAEWSEEGDVWSWIDGEIWNLLPCDQGGESIYVGNIYRDPVIRGHTNPDFDPEKYWEIMRKQRAEDCE